MESIRRHIIECPMPELQRMILEKSYRQGTFTLTSGQKSDFYIDVKDTALHHEGARLIGQCNAQLLRNINIEGIEISGVAGVTLGADPVVTATSMFTGVPGMIIRKEAKGHGTGRQIEGVNNVPKGSYVALLEDVITTGGTVIDCGVAALEKAGYKVAIIATIIDREEGGRQRIEKAGYKLLSLFTRTQLLDTSLL